MNNTQDNEEQKLDLPKPKESYQDYVARLRKEIDTTISKRNFFREPKDRHPSFINRLSTEKEIKMEKEQQKQKAKPHIRLYDQILQKPPQSFENQTSKSAKLDTDVKQQINNTHAGYAGHTGPVGYNGDNYVGNKVLYKPITIATDPAIISDYSKLDQENSIYTQFIEQSSPSKNDFYPAFYRENIDPVNPEEEIILNIEELANELAETELTNSGNKFKYEDLLEKYKKIIFKHERKRKE